METIKIIGSSGQISLGKKFAGRHVLVDEIESGVWIVKLGRFVPESERWLFSDAVKDDLDEAINWAERTLPQSSNLDELEKRVKG